MKKDETKSSWRCPKCGREFARKGTFHSCGQYTVEGYLETKNPIGVALFKKFTEVVQGIRAVKIAAAKTMVSFRVDSTFAMVEVSGRQLCGYLFLPREIPAPFFRNIKRASSRRFVHVFKFTAPDLMGAQLAQIVGEAIANASEADQPATESGRKESERSIGEEINALYRQDRDRRPASGIART